MKRFTETEKWSDPWFRQLKPMFKLAYVFLLDRCDHSGVCDVDRDLAEFQIGMPIDWDAFIATMGGRAEVLSNGKIHLTKFVGFQFGELSDASKPHQNVVRLMKSHGIYRVYKGYTEGIHTPKDKDQDKDKDKDKDKEKETDKEKDQDKQAENAIPFSSPEFQSAWADWKKHRTEIRKPMKPTSEGKQLKALLAMGEAGAIAAINHSIANGWTGIFPPHSVGNAAKRGNGATLPAHLDRF